MLYSSPDSRVMTIALSIAATLLLYAGSVHGESGPIFGMPPAPSSNDDTGVGSPVGALGSGTVEVPDQLATSMESATNDLPTLILSMQLRLAKIQEKILEASCQCAGDTGPKPSAAEMSALSSDVTTLMTTLDAKQDTSLNIQAGVETVKAFVAEMVVQDDATAIRNQIQTLQSDVEAMDNPESATEELTEAIKHYTSDSETLENDILVSYDEIAACEAQCSSSASSGDVDALRTKISDLRSKTTEMIELYETNSEAIGEDMATQLESEGPNRELQQSNINELNTNVATLNGDVESLETRAQELETTGSLLQTTSWIASMEAEKEAIISKGESFIQDVDAAISASQELLGPLEKLKTDTGEGGELQILDQKTTDLEQQAATIEDHSTKIAEAQAVKDAVTAAKGHVDSVNQYASLYEGVNSLINQWEEHLDALDQANLDIEDALLDLEEDLPELDTKYGARCTGAFTYAEDIDFCYYINDAELEWWDAQLTCQLIGGPRARLVVVDTWEKLSHLQGVLAEKDQYYDWYWGWTTDYIDYYVGWFTAANYYSDGTYNVNNLMWVDGTTVNRYDYSIWGWGQPSEAFSNMCGGLHQHYLDDMGCDWNIRSICEIPAKYLETSTNLDWFE